MRVIKRRPVVRLAMRRKRLKPTRVCTARMPYDQLTVCEVDFPLGGMEYPGLIFIGRDWMAESQADSLELMLAHETAHQWFYALVGSDQVTDAWQDEALCE